VKGSAPFRKFGGRVGSTERSEHRSLFKQVRPVSPTMVGCIKSVRKVVAGGLGRGVFAGILVFLVCRCGWGENWPRFRGPNGQGISSEKGIRVEWTDADYNWKLSLPGTGHSSPVVWDDTVFVTCADQARARAILLAIGVSDGSIRWQKRFDLPAYKMNRLNSYAASTPSVDAGYVYALWPSFDETLLVAFDHEGRQVWRRTFPGVKSQHGPCTSPVIVDDVVVFTHEHEETTGRGAQSFWIAVDRSTGQTRWKLPRRTGLKTSYSTPCLYSPKPGPRQLIFTSFSHGMTAVDPASGKVVWELESAFVSRVVGSPVVAGELVVGTCGDGSAGKYILAVRPSGSDRPEQAYKVTGSAASYVPTPLAVDGLLFTFHDRGQISCLDADTGRLLWQEKPAGRYYGSPVWVEGKLYAITTDGQVVVLRAAAKYELLAINALGQKSQATPAVANGAMYLRTDSQLFCLGAHEK